MEKCYKLKKTKGNPKCQEASHCYWDPKNRCKERKSEKRLRMEQRIKMRKKKNMTMKIDHIMEELKIIKSEVMRLRKPENNAVSLSSIRPNNSVRHVSPFVNNEEFFENAQGSELLMPPPPPPLSRRNNGTRRRNNNLSARRSANNENNNDN